MVVTRCSKPWRISALEQLFEQYERLDEDLKAELPLKRVWMVASQDDVI